jgi:site-specific recombinase XerC
MRLSALGQAYLRFAAARGQSPRTAEAYSGTYQQFVAYVLAQHFDDDVRAFTPDIVEGFATMLQERGLKASTIATMLAALQSMGTYGVKTKASGRYILDANPLDRVYRPKRIRPAEKYLGKDELLTLLAVPCEPAERLVLELLVDTAIRATELATTTAGQVRADGERVVLTVRVKGGRHRVDHARGRGRRAAAREPAAQGGQARGPVTRDRSRGAVLTVDAVRPRSPARPQGRHHKGQGPGACPPTLGGDFGQ